MFSDMTVGNFVDSLASSDAVPGGGSAGAIGGAFGASLILMALRISFKKTGMNDVAGAIEADLERGRAVLLSLADLDSEAYSVVMNAYGLPKDTPELKERRASAIQSALRNAAEVPMNTARACFSVMRLAFEAFPLCKDSCFSDAASGFHLACAGFRSALFNVMINLSSIKDEEFCGSMSGEVESMTSWLEEKLPEAGRIFAERGIA